MEIEEGYHELDEEEKLRSWTMRFGNWETWQIVRVFRKPNYVHNGYPMCIDMFATCIYNKLLY